MTLIQSNEATEELKASARNFELLSSLKQPAKREEVTTQVAQDCLEQIHQAHLGLGFKLKKFFATTFSYSSVLAMPFIALITTIWFTYAKIFSLDLTTLALSGSVIGGMLAADLALGKIFGIRPITACLIGAYDAYRQGAKIISRSVEKSYTDHEEAMKTLKEENRKVLLQELKTAYLGIAKQLQYRKPDEIHALSQQLPNIVKVFSGMGLNRAEISQILSPITETMRMIPNKKNPSFQSKTAPVA